MTTINKHIEGYTKPIYVQHYLMGALKQKGRILFNQSGKKFDWRVQFRQGDPYEIDDMEARNPQRTNFWRDATLPYRGAAQEEAVSKFEKLANKGPEGLIKIVSEMTPILTQSMNDYFAEQMFVNGTTAANSKKIHGVESWFGASAQVDDNAKVGTNSQTDYGGLSCVLGAYGGSWTEPSGELWPFGTGDREYEFWTPIVWDYTNAGATAWTATTKTWPNTYREVMEHAVTHMMLRKQKLDAFLIAPDLYLALLQALTSSESIQIERAASGSLALQLGYDALSFMGVDIVTEYSCPAATGYGLIFKELTLRSMQPQLFVFERDYDWQMKSDLIGVDFYGNMNISSPRASTKLAALT